MLSLSYRIVVGVCALVCACVAKAGPAGVEAVWLPVDIDLVTCPELSGYATADLYLAFDVPPGSTVAVTSDDETGLQIVGGEFHQDETGANGPRPDGWYKVFPCAFWDSYLTIGGTTPFFSPEYPVLDEEEWGTRIVAEWLPQPGEMIEVEMDLAKFGDLRHYVHIARLTGTPGTTSIAGELGVVYFPFPTMPTIPVEETITVMNCTTCWGSLDYNGDGRVDSFDLSQLLAQWGPCAGCQGDVNGDGFVDSFDLSQLLAQWNSSPSK